MCLILIEKFYEQRIFFLSLFLLLYLLNYLYFNYRQKKKEKVKKINRNFV